jgi:hypothetical protein
MSEEAKTESLQSARLTVSHPKEGNDMGRGLTLSLDGKDLPHLKAGRTISREIAPGQHRLRVNNTYHKKTVEFDAQPGEQVHYRIKNRIGFFGSMMITVLGAGPMYLEIERSDT